MLPTEKELAESIRYARNIQTALIPSLSDFQKILNDSFILNLPRDIVSGDFYWVSKVRERIVVVAADCTGHGVPGAFMSIMGINFLNQIVSYCVPSSNKILNQLREYVMKALNQSGAEGEQKDGLDLSLVVIDLEKQHIEFSGANNPLVYFKSKKLHVIKGDRMPIGISGIQEESFKKNIIPLRDVDSLYLFSDGYPDQFGGPKFKKLKYHGFREFLKQIHSFSMDKQREMLKENIEKWMGKEAQVDDILVIGVGLKKFRV
ncbi:MAG: SpoIIE family protein phosphatase [Bacteroidales bacterium]|nr:SpoIIE family protein phosphatase [Bacteroidales bacterium]MCF8391068.1 SpoIIE family protein phosphatase [Bacteroidales bacterium]